MSSNSTIKNDSVPELFLQKFKTILLLAIFVFSSSTMFGQGTVNFTVDMNSLDVPNAEYDNVVINGSWNGWLGWGVTLADEDSDGVFTGSADFDAGTSFEYVVAVTGSADGYSGWGMQFGEGCEDPNFMVTVGDSGSVTESVADVSCTVAPALATVDFSVDMNALDVPNGDYDNVVVNGSWNGWNGWGVTLADEDSDGVFTGSLELDAGTSFEYVIAVTGPADGYSGWGVQFASCDGVNFAATAGEEGSFTSSVAVVDCGVASVLGCMDDTACNYNMDATEDDASCTYAAEGFDCDGNCVSGTLVSYTAGSYPGENSFTISDCDGVVLAEMTSGADGFNSCVELGENYSISLVDSYGDSWNGGSLSIGGVDYTVGFDDNGGSSFSTIVGSCGVAGCMDASACNYNMDATFDDASCTYAAEGFDCNGACLDGGAVLTMTDSYGDGWNGNILTINGVDYTIEGFNASSTVCVPTADCYVMSWTEGSYSSETSWTFEGTSGSGGSAPSNIGDCVTGCTDVNATNYNADADISDATLCEYALVQGCMDATACNYDASAEQDDASCIYAAEGFDCDGNCVSGTLVSYTAGSYPGENSFTISDCDGVVLAEMTSGADGFNSCVELGENYSISLVDSYGDSWNGGSLSIGGVDYTVGFDDNGGSSFSTIVGSCGVAGCMDASACNYNMDATFDDASCTYAAEGFDCNGACLDGGAVLTMTDSYGDGWNGNILTINGVDYTIEGFNASSTVCVPTADCYVMSWTEGSYSSETSWTFEGTSGSGGSAPSNIGDCVTGCTDMNATNYNADADISDATLCEYALVQGCMDATACNYDASAEQDDASCIYAAEGFDCDGNCVSGTLVSYTAGSYPGENSFTISDCDGVVLAEMTSGADGFNSCVELGENYSISLVDSYGDSWNGGSLSIGGVDYTVGFDDNGGSSFSTIVGSCGVAGCMDASACNYNMDATFDDGTCDVPAEGFDCDGNCIAGTNVAYTSGSYAGENSFTISDCDGVVLAEMTSGYDGFNACIELGENYSISLVDSYGDSWNGGSLSIGGVDYTVGFDDNGGSSFSTLVGSCGLAGCTDSTAFNFNPDATFDDGSCEPVVAGCTNPFSNNYAAGANTDDGSCTFCVGGEEVAELAEGVYPDANVISNC
jgi:hypothetical protein